MIIQDVTIKNFRCFSEKKLRFDGRVVVIEGPNGSGKSSLLEALHYCCYLRSFRTHLHRDLVSLSDDYFFLDVGFFHHATNSYDRINVGFSPAEGKVVKFNERPIQSYKEIINHFRIVTLAADDLMLVNSSPEMRRDFLNYALTLHDTELITAYKNYKVLLDQRNKFLQLNYGGSVLSDELLTWTLELWKTGKIIQDARKTYLKSLEDVVNQLLSKYFQTNETAGLRVAFDYQSKYGIDFLDQESFVALYESKIAHTEKDFARTLFGPHLDDFVIFFHDKKARVFASRGQQKLLVLLIKIAQLTQLSLSGEPGVLLLDDFMTDFDTDKVQRAVAALQDLTYQLFISCPINPDAFLSGVKKSDLCHIKL